MESVRRFVLLLIIGTAGALSAPAVAASVQTPEAGLTIRLAEVPADRVNDPRAMQYVVDHLAPGAVIKRKVEITNDTGRRALVRVYGGGATIADGNYTPDDKGEVASWISVSKAALDLAPDEAVTVVATIAVPAKATEGERYGAIWAELPGVENPNGITEVSRVGVRTYLSVGPGGEPKSAFLIEALTASRGNDGAPIISARVRNTGGRALDMTGDLMLEKGPGGLTAGPFPAELGTTLGIAQTAPVTVTLDKRIPAGPWEARMTLRSGTEVRQAKATVTFPDQPGESAAPVGATEIEKQKRVLLPVAGVLLVLTGGALIALLIGRRRSKQGERRGGVDSVDAQEGLGTKR